MFNITSDSFVVNKKILPLFSDTLNGYKGLPENEYFYNSQDTDRIDSGSKRITPIIIKILDGTENVRNFETNLVDKIRDKAKDNNSDLYGVVEVGKYSISRNK